MAANTHEETGKSIASRLKHRFVYGLIWLGGRRAAYLFLYILAGVYSCFPSVVKKSSAYISRRFSPKNKFQFWKHTYLLNLTFGKTLVDRAALGILGKTEVTSTQEERDLFIRLSGGKKGLIALTAHVGCWQMATYLMTHFLNVPVNVLYYRNPKDNDKTIAQHQGQKSPYTFINPAGELGGVVEMMSALWRGEVVCGMGDRVFGNEKNAVTVSFLGGKIRVPYSFYRLASATGAPIILVFCPWQECGRFETWTFPVMEVPSLPPSKENYVRFAQQFAGALEEFCIKYPYQFFNYFDLWENVWNQ